MGGELTKIVLEIVSDIGRLSKCHLVNKVPAVSKIKVGYHSHYAGITIRIYTVWINNGNVQVQT